MKKVLFELLYTLASNYQFGNPSGQIGVPNALALCRWQLRKVVRKGDVLGMAEEAAHVAA